MMKILLFVSEYPPYGDTSVIHYFARQWVKEGNDVHVIYDCNRLIFPFYLFAGQMERRQSAGRLEEYVLDDVKVLKVPLVRCVPRKKWVTFTSKKKAIKAVERYLDRNGSFDVIVSHYCSNHFYLTEIARKKIGCPVVSVFHVVDTQDAGLAKKIIESSRIVAVRSNRIESFLRNEVGFDGEITKILSGIPSRFVMPVRKSEQQKKIRFVYVGKLQERKRVKDLIEAFGKLPEDIDFSFEIIGDGLERSALEKTAAELRLNDKVSFCGNLPRDDVAAHMRASDCFIMVSVNETFGLVYLEAMAAGCIVIGSKGEGIDGIIADRENGFLAEPKNVDEIREKIEQVARLSPSQKDAILQNAHSTVEQMTDERIAENYYEILKRALAE